MDKNYSETPNLDVYLYSKRKEPTFTNSFKLNNNYNSKNGNGIFNQFTSTAFTQFKSNKNPLIKSDQLLMPNNYNNNNLNANINNNTARKDNISNLAKNYWASDIRTSASPTKLHRLSVTSSKPKNFSITNSSKFLNK